MALAAAAPLPWPGDQTGHRTASSAESDRASDGASDPRGGPEWIDESFSESFSDEPGPVPPLRSPGRRRSVVAALRLSHARGRVIVGVGVAMVIALCVAFVMFSARPDREVPPELPAPPLLRGSDAPDGGPIVVSVVGRVTSPGLVTLPLGARVNDAVRAAGGPVAGADLTELNLARRLSDGEQVYVGVPAPSPDDAASSSPTRPARIDLNSASVSQLDALPGVGEVTARRIVERRAQRGRFTSVEQLRELDGIGDTRLARLKDLVTVR